MTGVCAKINFLGCGQIEWGNRKREGVVALPANVCKLNATHFPFEMTHLAQDIAGGTLVTMPSLNERENPENGPYVKRYLMGREGKDNKCFHFNAL
jgi:4-hydroxybutyryl-CoA dehydratase/vinylacetyl-CoA-Delta-isomerase